MGRPVSLGCKYSKRKFRIPESISEKDWLKIESEFEKMLNVAYKNKARLVIVYIPVPWMDKKYPVERLMSWGKKHNVLIVDPSAAIEEAKKLRQVYWKEDFHCTEAGYEVIAEYIYTKLIELKMVP